MSSNILQQYRADQVPLTPCPCFGGMYFIRKWSGRDRAKWESIVFNREGEKAVARQEIFQAATVALSLCNEDRTPVFTVEEIEGLAEVDSNELTAAFEIASKVNGLDRSQKEDARKN